jgi:hypothetical protein
MAIAFLQCPFPRQKRYNRFLSMLHDLVVGLGEKTAEFQTQV